MTTYHATPDYFTLLMSGFLDPRLAHLCTHSLHEAVIVQRQDQSVTASLLRASQAAKVRDLALAKLKTVEKQKADVERVRDELRCALALICTPA